MFEFINHNSFLLAALFLLVVAGLVLLRRGLQPRRLLTWGGLVLALVVVWLLVRPQAGVRQDVEIVKARIGAGTPVLVEFQSPY